MNLVKGLIAGLVAGLVGAGIWAGISYGTGYEIGWLAWGIGAIVGLAVAWASDAGPVPGLLAVVISVLSIAAGKYAAVHFVFERELGDRESFVSERLPDVRSEELIISYVADEVVAEHQADGETIDWPNDVEVPEQESDYPPEIWSDAVGRWTAMGADDQTDYREGIEAKARADIGAFYDDVRSGGQMDAFKASFGLFDIVFFLLAIVTAFKIAASGEVAEGIEA